MKSLVAADRGSLVLSFDLQDPAGGGERVDERFLSLLLDLCSAHRVGASWAIAGAGGQELGQTISRATVASEITLAAQGDWGHATCARRVFGDALYREASRLRAGRVAVTSIALPGSTIGERRDLLAKHGFTAVRAMFDRAAQLKQAGAVPVAPRWLSHGVWELPASLYLDRAPRWPWSAEPRAIRQLLRQAADARQIAHLVIYVPQLAESARRGAAYLESILRQATQLRDQGKLAIEPLSATVQRVTALPTSTPARSILRAA
jgi:hypothetical protein